MSVDERLYMTFENVSRTFHQIVNRAYDIKKYEFDGLCSMEFKGENGDCTTTGKGWLSIFLCCTEGETTGSLTMDICAEEQRCKSFSIRGHVVSNKNFTSVAEKSDNGSKEKILTISYETGKLTVTYFSISKVSFENRTTDNEIRLLNREECQKMQEKKKYDEKRQQQKDRPLKQKDKRREDTRKTEEHDGGMFLIQWYISNFVNFLFI